MNRALACSVAFVALASFASVSSAQCTNDGDADGVCDEWDNCPNNTNPSQANFDGDGTGDACDPCTDTDGDAIGDPGFALTTGCTNGSPDNCSFAPNPSQTDADSDGRGDACDICPAGPNTDADGDGICDSLDTCPGFPPTDDDGDGVCNAFDNCPNIANAAQTDFDGDSSGDPCDPCTDIDGDNVGDPGYPSNSGCSTPNPDNCRFLANSDQSDLDGDGLGNACDTNNDSSPSLLNYQGHLTDPDGLPLTTTVSMAFQIVDAGGNSLGWSETQSVAVQEGAFTVLLGIVTPFPAGLFSGPPTDSHGAVRYLRVSVNGEPLTPDRRIVSVPYQLTVEP